MKKLTLVAIALLASVVSFALNPFAYGLSSSLSDDGVTLTVNYSLNANAKAVNVVVLNGEEVVATIPCDGIAKGDHSVQISTVELPKSVALTWKVNVEGTSVEVPTQETQMYNLYCPHGLAIDKNPESENFGRILVAEGMQAVPATNYLSSGKGAGLYVFNPSFASDSVVYKGGNDFTRLWSGQGYQPWRVKISEDGRIFVSSLDLNGVVVWEVSKDLQTWTPVIAGAQDENGNILDAGGNFVAGMNVSMDVVGSGENLKLLLYSCSTKAASFALSAYRLDEYALGTATTFTGTPKNILIGGYAIVHTNAEFIYDGEGGYWFGASRSNTSGTPAKNLAHINANGVEDYTSTDGALYGGDGVLVHNGMLFKGKARTSSTVGNFGVWTIGKDAEGNTTLTEKWTVSANGIGRNLNEFAVDYAENLYIVGNSGEKMIAYALPYDGNVATPAASKYAFQLEAPATPEPEYQVIEDEITNFVFDLEAWPMVCTGGPSENYQIEVYLVLTEDADGTLDYENSSVSIMGQKVTLIEGALSNIDVYTPSADAVLRVQMGEEYYELHLTMSAATAEIEATVIEIADATVTIEERSLGFGDAVYYVLKMESTWSDGETTYPVLVETTEFDSTKESQEVDATITVGGQGDEDPWLGSADGKVTITIADDLVTVKGLLENPYTQVALDVTISGTLPVEEPVEMVGVVKRALQVGESVVVLTHEADGTPHIYNMVGETITEVSQEGVVATDPENPGDHLAISDIAVTDDGKLVAVNYVRCYNAPAYVESGYKEGTTRFYMWDALTADPTIWFTSKSTANSLKSDQGYTMALNGSSTDCQIIITGVHRYGNGARFSSFNMVDGALTSTSYFGWSLGTGSGEEAVFDEAIDGTNFQLAVSPRNNKKDFIMDAEKIAPVEWQIPPTSKEDPIVLGELDSTLIGVKYNGVSYVTYEMKTLAVAPYADADGKLAGIKVLDVTEGFEVAEVVKVVDLDAPVAATAAATAVAVEENGLTITLVADATVYTFMVELNLKPTIYTITATANPVEGGNIEGLENEGAYEAGTELTLRAIANEGYEFVKWTVDNTIVGTEVEYTFIVASNVEMVAHFKKDGPVEIIGIVKRALQLGESVVVLTHEADATPHIYNVVGETITEVSQEGVVARDPENAGDYLAISDIASTEDGKLVAVNYMMCQNEATNVDAGYKRGETRFYLWNDIAADPSIWFTSKMTSNWFRSKQGYTIALKGTSQNAEIFTTGVHGQNGRTRFSWFHIIDGVYEEPAVNTNDYYHFHNGPDNIHATGNSLEALVGNQYELNASPLADNLWIMDGNLVEPYEYVLPATNNVVLTEGVAIDTELGKKFNGATYITIDDQVLMVAPYATAEGLLAGVKVLDITAGLASATEIAIANLDAAVEATAAATAVVVDEDELIITLVGDATLYTLTAELTQDPGPGTTLDNVDVEVKASKMIKNGQLVIIKEGIQYNILGAVVK